MKGVDPEVDAALAPPQLASLVLADHAASRSEDRGMARSRRARCVGRRIPLQGLSWDLLLP